MMNRRDFSKGIAAGALMTAAFAPPRAQAAEEKRKPLEVGMLLYPGLTLLDLIGPQTVLARATKVHLVWKTRDAITTDTGIQIHPTATLNECPKDLDVLFVPGGGGMNPVMRDADVMDFLKDRGARAKYVTSVCSGSIILGAAGLLRGYKATSHWAACHLLPMFGAEYTEGRVVVDRNRMTGGGVTAGIDFGLVLLATLRGDETAKATQLMLEYDPQPPFHAGSPKGAGPALTQQIRNAIDPINQET